MFRKVSIFLLLMIFLPLLTGCWDVEEISRRGVANVVFFDVGEESKFKLGVVLSVPGTEVPPIVGTTQQFEKRHYVVTGESDSMVEAWTEVQAATVRNIFFGQIRAVILSEEIARNNLRDVLDFIGRFPMLPPNTHVLISKEDPGELMDLDNPDNYSPGNYIDFYFQSPHSRSLAIPTTLWQVNSFVDKRTSDPFLPVIKSLPDDKYLIGGTALFSRNRMAGELSRDETEILALIRGTDIGYLTVPLGEKEHAGLSDIRSTTSITPRLRLGNELSFDVDVNAHGGLLESYPHRRIGWQEKTDIERNAEALMKREIETLISKFQELNTDPVGFGEKLRINYPREWENIDWHQIYPDAVITVRATFTVKETGIFR